MDPALAIGAGALVALGLPAVLWRLSPDGPRGWRLLRDGTVAAGGLLAWGGLVAAALGDLIEPYDAWPVSLLVGFLTGAAIARWGAVLLPFCLVVPSALFDDLVRAREFDPTPVTPFLALFFAPAVALALAAGVTLVKLRARRK